MLELYYFPTATCGYKARLTLAEKGVDFTHRVLDRDAGELVMPAYLKLNPNAVVPTMVHDGAVLIESSIIMVYTDTAFDGPALQPDSALGRARVAAWLKRADDQYLPALGAVTYGLFRRKEILRKTPQELDAGKGVDHANALVGYGVEPPPAKCPTQPTNASYEVP